MTVQVENRLVIAGGFDLFALGVEQGVVELDHGVFGYLHEWTRQAGLKNRHYPEPSAACQERALAQAESPCASICSSGSVALTLTLPWAAKMTR